MFAERHSYEDDVQVHLRQQQVLRRAEGASCACTPARPGGGVARELLGNAPRRRSGSCAGAEGRGHQDRPLAGAREPVSVGGLRRSPMRVSTLVGERLSHFCSDVMIRTYKMSFCPSRAFMFILNIHMSYVYMIYS